MTSPAPENPQLMDLLSAVWDECLDDAGRERLEELLEHGDSPAMEELHAFTKLHLDLEWLASSKSAQEKAFKSLQQVIVAERLHRSWPSRRTVALAALAAAILVIVFSVWETKPVGYAHLERMPQPIGKIVRLEGAAWSGGNGPKTGDIVLTGQSLNLRRGYAHISMGFGADVLLQAPCQAELTSGSQVILKSGTVAVRAAKWAKGFQIKTRDLLATDLGTWFSVESGTGRPSEVHVIEGLVLAKPLRDGQPNSTQRVAADQAVTATSRGAIQPTEFRRDPASNQLRQFRPLRPVQIWNTGLDRSVGEEDPHWRVIAGESESGPYPTRTFVNAPHGSYGVNEPDRSQWISVKRGTEDGVPARSSYTFETTFDLSGFELDSVVIFGQILADDGVDEIWLNGERLNIERWKDWRYGAQYVKFHPIEIREGFVSGINRLAIVVKNETYIERADHGFDLPNVPNPMALRAEWQAFGRPLPEGAVD